MSDQLLLDVDLAALAACLSDGNANAAFLRLKIFEAQLTRYIRGEELVLFPVLERFVAIPATTTAKMRSEHARLQGLIEALWDALAVDDWQRGLDALSTLRSVLLLHCEKEERVLAPLLRVTEPFGLES